MADANHLEQLAHVGAALAQQAFTAPSIVGDLFGRRRGHQRLGARLDAQIAQKRRLLDRAVHAGGHAFGGAGERLEIDMRGQIDLAGRSERAHEGVARDGLQGLAGRAA